MPHILVVDSDTTSQGHTTDMLAQARYRISTAIDGRSALRQITTHSPDLVLLESLLPDQDGFEVCRRIRRSSDVPVIFFSTRAQTDDRIAGLRSGADDYLSKRCAQIELMARIQAVMARAERARRPPRAPMSLAGWTLDPERQVCTTSNGHEVELTPRELHLLSLLFKRAGQVCPTPQIVRHVWNYAGRQARSIVATSVWRLRSKLEEDAQQPRHLLTVRNVGYTFQP
ncbi:MAG: response regulator transcription factor [Roseiflexaceae bacterium]|jgi:DNA-binding response OmpR family regulator